MLDLIIGIHSIIHALNNPRRGNKKLYATEESLGELLKRSQLTRSRLSELGQYEILATESFDRNAQRQYKERNIHYQRIPGRLLLEIDPLQTESVTALHKNAGCKILCLDRVNDIQNAAAIMRTAAFYGAPFLLIARKGGFGVTPAFYRLASGAAEYVRIVPVNNLSRALIKLKEKGFPVVGFSEKGLPWDNATPETFSAPPCLVLGAEGQGLSNAVERCLDKLVQIPPHGPLSTLNVSVASALAMEKFWNTK